VKPINFNIVLIWA